MRLLSRQQGDRRPILRDRTASVRATYQLGVCSSLIFLNTNVRMVKTTFDTWFRVTWKQYCTEWNMRPFCCFPPNFGRNSFREGMAVQSCCRTVFEKDHLGPGRATSIELLNEYFILTSNFYVLLFGESAWATGSQDRVKTCSVEQDSVSGKYSSFPYVSRFSMVILNELYARLSVDGFRQIEQSNLWCVYGHACIFVSPLVECRVSAFFELSI